MQRRHRALVVPHREGGTRARLMQLVEQDLALDALDGRHAGQLPLCLLLLLQRDVVVLGAFPQQGQTRATVLGL